MIYQSNQMTLQSVMTVFRGVVNDAYVCKRIDGEEGLYLVLTIHDHTIAKQFIRMIEKSNKAPCHKAVFSDGKAVSVAFEYTKPRQFDAFLPTVPKTVDAYQSLCIGLVLRCMESPAPYPLLYLMLTQKQLHLMEDGQVKLSYAVDLKELDTQIDEKDCAMLLSGMLRDLLSEVKADKNTSYQLLLKKIPKQRYAGFRELYRDLCLSRNEKHVGFFTKQKLLLLQHKQAIANACILLCIILFIVACVCMLCEAIYGEIPIFRLFHDGMRQIGTEQLY